MINRFSVAMVKRLSRVTLSEPMSGFFKVPREAFAGAVRNRSQLGLTILFDLMGSSP